MDFGPLAVKVCKKDMQTNGTYGKIKSQNFKGLRGENTTGTQKVHHDNEIPEVVLFST
jgi:hypothetical protein